MKIDLTYLPELYKTISSFDYAYGEECSGGGVALEDEVVLSYRISSGPVTLPSPFRLAAFTLQTRHQKYWASISVALDPEFNLGYMVDKLTEKMGKSWLPYRDRRSPEGALLNKDEEPVVTISRTVVDHDGPLPVYCVNIGDSGSLGVNVTSDMGQFLGEMGLLSKVANYFIDSCVQSGKRALRLPAEIPIACIFGR